MAKQPHVILIMTDQQRADTLAAYGDRQCDTPHLDRLADQSIVFDRHYSPCPLCVPTRTAMATGLYPHRSGAMINTWIPEERQYGTLRPEYTTIFERLLAEGYNLGHIGVQHIFSEPSFQERCDGATFIGKQDYSEYLQANGLTEPKLTEYRAPCPEFINGRMICDWYTSARTGRHPLPAEHFFDSYLSTRAVEFIESADTSQPLALACLLWAPHPPLAVPAPYDTLYDPAKLELPVNVGQRYSGQPASQLMNLPGFMGATVTMEQWRQVWAAYLGLVTMADRCIGQVVEALWRRGLWDDALVIFTVDHGEMLGSHRMWQKMCMYEEAIRVPLLIKPPGAGSNGRGVRRSQLTSHVDVPATICDYLGIDWQAGDGMSLRPVIETPASPTREMVYSEFNGNAGRGSFQRAAITASHKYIHNEGDHAELYNLEHDPLERENLIGKAEVASTQQQLHKALHEWMSRSGDFLDIGQSESKPC